MVVNGIEYSESNGEMVIWRCVDEEIVELDIPEEINGCPVVQIDTNAFQGLEFLESVWLPKTMEVVDSGAFSECQKLKEVVCYSEEIDLSRHAFSNCPNLTKFIADGEVTVGMCAFKNCFKLELFTGMITDIRSFAFANCRNLSCDITFGSRVYKFYSNAFSNCPKLKRIIFCGIVEQIQNLDSKTLETIEMLCNPKSNMLNLAYEGYNVQCG